MKNELTILERMARGEENAYEECMTVYGPMIRGSVRTWFSQVQEIEDLVQDIFIELWRSAKRFDATIAVETAFIRTIVKRQMINQLRRNKRHTNVSLPEGMDVPHDVQLSAEQRLDADRISRYMDEFRPDQRTVLSLFFKMGMSHGEISKTTKLAVGTVKSHIRRGVKLMRRQVETTPAGALAQARAVR